MDVTSKTLSALNGLPFHNLIGGPLSACVDAQAEAARCTVNFIKEIGLNSVPVKVKAENNGKTVEVEDEQLEAVYIYFTFVQNGKKVVISVPILTIVPIPYIAINTIDINFKATVAGVQSESDTTSFSREYTETSKRTSRRIFSRKKTTLNTSFSTKRDSKSTRDSSYSIEATIDVAVHASQDSMPAGMAKVLELLGSAMDLCKPDGELTVNDTQFYVDNGKTATLVAVYKDSTGLYSPAMITCTSKGEPKLTEESATFELPAGTYTVSDKDKKHSIDIKVTANPAVPNS